jgi:hypothetical protein
MECVCIQRPKLRFSGFCKAKGMFCRESMGNFLPKDS